MRKTLSYVCFLFSATLFSQEVFTKVRKSIAVGNCIAEIVTLDSCFNKSYYSDSALFYKTMVNIKLGKNQSAKKTIKTLSKLYPQFIGIHYLNGLIYFGEENFGKSVDEFNLALKEDSKNFRIYYNRSVALGLMEEYLSAIEDLNTCVELNKEYTLAYYSRAYWYEFTGNYVEAIRDYENVIRLEPKNCDAYLGLAFIFRDQKEPVKACNAINSAMKEGSQVAMELHEIFCK